MSKVIQVPAPTALPLSIVATDLSSGTTVNVTTRSITIEKFE